MKREPLTTRALLTLLMTATAFGALLTAGIVMFVLEVPRTRAEMSRELDSLAHLLGSRSSAALVFRDETTARENLQSLAGLPQIARACLFTETGELLANFERGVKGEKSEPCVPREPLTLDFVQHDGSRVHLQTTIEEAGRTVGAIQLSSTAAPLRERLAVQGTSLAVALAIALALAVVLAFRLQRVISRPVAHVRAVVDAIIHRGDMTQRAPATGPREIGQLAVAFNRMLDTVRRQNDDLASREAYSRRLFHESQIAQLVLDEHGVCVDSNVAAADLFGAAAREALLGQRLDAFFVAPKEVDLEAALQLLRWPSGPLRPARIECEMLREGGETWQGAIDFMRFELEGRALLHCTLHDVGAQRAAQAAKQAQLAAESASRAKTEFLSRMSHELRTPLNATLGFVQLVQRDGGAALDARTQRQLHLAQQAGWHLLALIDDTLDVARIEAGKLELSPRNVGVAEALDEALAFNESQADEAGVVLERGLRAGTERIAVRADPRRLRQILLNLVSNAIKYNRRGGHVATEIEVVDDEVAITIADDGLGMSAEQRRHLFEPFNRLGRESSAISGTGIGLALSLQLAQMMGGSLELHSAPDRGTRARLALPLAPDEPLPARSEFGDMQTLPRPLGACVLYIEDNPINLLLVEQCLSVVPDLRLITADTGAEGLERLAGERPDLVLLDMQLPDMTGLDVLARIATMAPAARPRVVALSASAMHDEVKAALAAGAADYWTKPIDVTRFVGQVVEALATTDVTPAPSVGPRATQPAPASAD